jgi:hypothetical protein
MPKGGVALRYTIGSFVGREARLIVRTGPSTDLTFRIPKELFRSRQRLQLEVSARDEEGSESILWAKRYEAGWQASAPRLEPVTDLLGDTLGTHEAG